METEYKKQIGVLASDKKRNSMLKVELDLLAISGIDLNHVKSADLFINENEFIHYIEVSKTPKIMTADASNVLLLVHGYGGFGAVYYKVLSELSDQFHCIAIDIPGMGFSSRSPCLPFECIDTCIEYFVSRIKMFADKMGLTRFSLVGHSLGGYIAGHYFKLYHDQIEKLFLLSPAGMNIPFEDQKSKFMQFHEHRGKFAKWLIRSFAEKIFEKKKNPFGFLFWPFKGKAINLYLNSPRFSFSPEERKLMYILMDYFMSLPECGERSLGYLLYYGMHSHRPITQILDEKKERSGVIHVMWGENDWMDKEATVRKFMELELDIKISYAPRADHQLPFQSSRHIKDEIMIAFNPVPRKDESNLEDFEVKININ
jgi:pimeloyl-ACP methyl ester carboxylesterase